MIRWISYILCFCLTICCVNRNIQKEYSYNTKIAKPDSIIRYIDKLDSVNFQPIYGEEHIFYKDFASRGFVKKPSSTNTFLLVLLEGLRTCNPLVSSLGEFISFSMTS